MSCACGNCGKCYEKELAHMDKKKRDTIIKLGKAAYRMSCMCSPAYKDRELIDPACIKCNVEEEAEYE